LTQQIHNDSSPRAHVGNRAIDGRIHTNLTERFNVTRDDAGPTRQRFDDGKAETLTLTRQQDELCPAVE
jgi:hypothetical protein